MAYLAQCAKEKLFEHCDRMPWHGTFRYPMQVANKLCETMRLSSLRMQDRVSNRWSSLQTLKAEDGFSARSLTPRPAESLPHQDMGPKREDKRVRGRGFWSTRYRSKSGLPLTSSVAASPPECRGEAATGGAEALRLNLTVITSPRLTCSAVTSWKKELKVAQAAQPSDVCAN
eukprot:s1396_g19.t1